MAMTPKHLYIFFVLIFSCAICNAKDTSPFCIDNGVGVSSNPSPEDHIGTGKLAEWLFGKRNNRLSLEGLWILDVNQLFTGGKPSTNRGSVNDLFQLELLFKPAHGALLAVEFLQLNGAPTNANAGLVQGFEGLIEAEPLTRTDLYQWWYRQEWLHGNLITRIGKSTPNADFNSVNRLYPMNDPRPTPAASGLIYGSLFTQGSITSFLPSYYCSAFGASAFYFPTRDFYISFGGYDGNKARGVQTDRTSPQFNGYYFLISEMGYSWAHSYLPGRIALGAWKQTGKFTLDTDDATVKQNGVNGIYLFGSQRLWWKDKCHSVSGVVTFLQLGINNTKTLPITKFLGWGLTGYGLISGRLKDSMGLGISVAGLNQNREPYANEWMIQTYYQYHVCGALYLEPVVSFIPRPGAAEDLPPTWAGTLRLLAHF
jgi:porin